jgi:hypothetical protein
MKSLVAVGTKGSERAVFTAGRLGYFMVILLKGRGYGREANLAFQDFESSLVLSPDTIPCR